MKRLVALLLVALGAVFLAPGAAQATRFQAAGISMATPGPYSVGMGVTYLVSVSPKLTGGEYPVVDTACYQDVDGDGVIEHGYPWDDVVFSELDRVPSPYDVAYVTVTLGGYDSIWKQRGGGPAECDANLNAISWKGGREYVRTLTSLSFNTE